MIARYISQSWEAYKKHFWQIIGALILISFITIGILVATGLPLLGKFIQYAAQNSAGGSVPFSLLAANFILDSGAQQFISLFMAGIVFSVIIGTVLEAGLVSMYADALRGKPEIGTILSVARKKFWTIIGANAIVGLVILALFAALIVPWLFLVLSAGASSVYATLWFYAGLIIFTLAALFFSLVNQAVVIGDLRAVDSVRKSFSIVRQNYLQFLVLSLVLSLIASAISLIPAIGALISFFLMAPIAGLSYTAFYIEKAGFRKRAARKAGKRIRKKR
jgi:hypothetical protein